MIIGKQMYGQPNVLITLFKATNLLYAPKYTMVSHLTLPLLITLLIVMIEKNSISKDI